MSQTPNNVTPEMMELLARRLQRRKRDEGLIVRQPREGATPSFPLSFAQRRLWFLSRYGESTGYNVAAGVAIDGPLDGAAMAAAIAAVERRHEILRTVYVDRDDEARQRILPPGAVRLAVVDLSALEDPDGAAKQRAVAAARQPFDLERGPMLRPRLFILGPQRFALILALHHIAIDGWSALLLLRELRTRYAAFQAGQPSPLAEPALQYADFAVWQRRALSAERLEAKLAYWRDRLADAPALDMPLDRARPAVRSTAGARLPLTIAPAASAELRALAKRANASLFHAALALFHALLQRYTGQNDIVLGAPFAGRTRPELAPMLGCFVNTLPLRVRCPAEASFNTLLSATREAALDAERHQDLPFEKIVDALQPDRDPSRTPFYQATLNFQRFDGAVQGEDAPAAPMDLRFSPFNADTATSKYDLLLDLEETEDGLSGWLEYCPALFDTASMVRFRDAFLRLAAAVADAPDRPLAALPLLDAETRARLLAPPAATMTETAAVFDGEARLHRLFARSAARWPDRVALTAEGSALTYASLDRRANRYAALLQRRGVGVEDRIGVFFEPGPELIAVMLAVLKTGAAYVPLDPAYPAARLRLIAEDAGMKAIVADPALAPAAPAALTWRFDRDALATAPAIRPVAIDPDNAAYAVYTSGSTGRPKGALLSHRNAARLFAATRRWFDFNEADVWSLFHSHAFDFSVWEIWGALCFGGKLAIASRTVRRDPAAFHQLLLRQRVSCLSQSPTAFRQLADHNEALAEPARLRLRWIFFGAEALDPRALQSWTARHGFERPRLINMYGITETCVHATYRPIAPQDLTAVAPGSPIGVPIPDMAVYTLDSRMEPAPVGVDGEIHVAGHGLARGYLNRPDLTAARFIPNPHGSDGDRLYRSGDMARRQPDGDLRFQGRCDSQVKIRGYRIELGEIQACLLEVPDIAQAAALVRHDRKSGPYLMAYVAPKANRAVEAAALKTRLRDRLPDYMVPAGIRVMDALPMTAHGKLDRGALPGLEPTRGNGSPAALSSETEEIFAAIWADILGVDQVGADDGFFDLGGDSILAVRAVAQARKRGLTLDLPTLFRNPVLRDAARASERAGAGEAPRPVAPFELLEPPLPALPEDVVDAYPMSQLQLGMLYHLALEPELAPYHNVSSWLLRGRMDMALFDRAVQAVVARHPALRTSLHLQAYDAPLQLVRREARLPIHFVDLRGQPADAQRRICRDCVAAERKRPFDLRQAPLLRFAVHLIEEKLFRFTLTECHPILDGWSLTSALTEMYTRYFSLLAGETPRDPEPIAAGYADFIRLEREALASPEQRAFWDGFLAGSQPTRIPAWPRELGRARNAGPCQQSRFLPSETLAGLRRLARATQTPLKSALMAGHAKTMGQLAGVDDALIGVQSHGRPEMAGGDRALGLFLNTLPIRIDLRGGGWRDLVRRVFDTERKAMPYRRYPFSAIQEKRGTEPLIGNFFNYLHFHSTRTLFESGQVRVQAEQDGSLSQEPNHYPLNLNIHLDPVGDALSLTVDAPDGEYGEAQLRFILDRIEFTLAAMAATPDAPHEAMDAPVAEKRRALERWQGRRRPHAGPHAIHEAVAASVRRHPDRIALSFGTTALTFHELDEAAGRLAARLAALGVGPETAVGVAMTRSLELPVALLAVLKAGAVYVPLKPSFPADRLAWTMMDAGVTCALAQKTTAAALPRLPGPCLALDWDDEASAWPDIAPLTPLARPAEPNQAAYLIYTSGSTGRPKGVVNAHGPVLNRLRWMAGFMGIDENDRVIQKTPFGFDVSVWEFFLPMLTGAALTLCPPDSHKDPLQLRSFMAASGVTTAHFVPSMLAAFLTANPDGVPAGLKRIVCSGEALSEALVQRFQRTPGAAGAALYNLYGPTEAAIDVAAWDARERVYEGAVPIGAPIDNVRLHILDRRMRLAPLGSPGELFIGGAAPARGYRRRPDLTAAAFLPDPFGPEPGARLYRSGDRACWLPDGTIAYLGRKGSQIKLRGQRIELKEIESLLNQAPGVARALVVLKQPRHDDQRLVAYIVPRPDAAPDLDALRAALRRRLPAYMIPSDFALLQTVPLTPNGKVDLRALPDPTTQAEHGRERIPPRSRMEKTVAKAWAKALRRKRLSVRDNLFDIGGHSFTAMQINLALNETLNRRFPLAQVYAHPTIEDLAAYLEQSEKTTRPESGEPLPAVGPGADGSREAAVPSS